MLKKILLFITIILLFSEAYCLNLDKIKIYFLEGNYKQAILEGEKLLAKEPSAAHSDEFYYILGLSYLKDSNYLRACDIFEIILKEFKNSDFKEEAELGLGDTYFLRGDFRKAEDYYKELISTNPNTKLKAQVYYRLSQIGFKKGDTQQAEEYSQRLKQDFPLNPELILDKNICTIYGSSADLYYTVQVGSFSRSENAKNLTQNLIQKGYPAYIEEIVSKTREKIYRVRVGKFRTRQEAMNSENKLSQEGYPTRICP